MQLIVFTESETLQYASECMSMINFKPLDIYIVITYDNSMTSKIIQVISHKDHLVLLCKDGSLWSYSLDTMKEPKNLLKLAPVEQEDIASLGDVTSETEIAGHRVVAIKNFYLIYTKFKPDKESRELLKSPWLDFKWSSGKKAWVNRSVRHQGEAFEKWMSDLTRVLINAKEESN